MLKKKKKQLKDDCMMLNATSCVFSPADYQNLYIVFLPGAFSSML